MATRFFLPAGSPVAILTARNSPSLPFGLQSPSPSVSAKAAHPRRGAAAIRASSADMPSASIAPATEEIEEAAPATSTSLVASVPGLVTLEGAAGLAQVNHYEILQVPFGSSVTEIIQAYRARREEVASQQTPENEVGSNERLRLLRESFELLTSDEERKIYDWALQRYYTQALDTYIWPYETDITQRQMSEDKPPFEAEVDEEGTRRLGLFFLGWVIVSMILGATMKTWVPYHPYAGSIWPH